MARRRGRSFRLDHAPTSERRLNSSEPRTSQSHLQATIFSIVKALIVIDFLLVCALLLYSAWAGLPFVDVVPFALILLVASVPVALPATFTLATALGATELAHNGVLVTRLSAIEEAAGMDVLCTDKTGTITENRLALAATFPFGEISEDDVLRAAALACDPVDARPDRSRHSFRRGGVRSSRKA